MYKLVNKTTKEETICTKVNVDGFDYYVNKQAINSFDWYYLKQVSDVGTHTGIYQASDKPKVNKLNSLAENIHKVICTTNPNIDVFKVIDEVEELFTTISKNPPYCNVINKNAIMGYNKHKETNPFSEEDMIEFGQWAGINEYRYNKKFLMYQKHFINETLFYTSKELLKLWKEQKVETIYYQ